ncbi:MAG TPA: SLC13 family permease [Bryobacteraceae bacterium]|nr:SLC13 family permease [Bryobacteraceae bacterium]
MSAALIYAISAATIACILFRPYRWPEAVWAAAAAALLVLCGLLPAPAAGQAIARGTDVYLFLAGMMLLAELARCEGVFDWLAGHAVTASRRSPSRLFAILYGVGVVVTVFLSNDATAVVLTPAVYAAVRKARTEPLPHLLGCALVANAASFVLPISNPANLVVYGRQIPALVPWLRLFLLPSGLAIAATFVALRWLSRAELGGMLPEDVESSPLSEEGRRALWGLGFGGAVMIYASSRGMNLGVPTCAAAAAAVLITRGRHPRAVAAVGRGVTWSVLPLVAGLFVMVEALGRAGALRLVEQALGRLAPAAGGALAAAFGAAALSNVMNNLPSGLLAGSALQAMTLPQHLRQAVTIGVDLGPNLSIYGSLATILWLVALRREGAHVDGWTFFKAGVMAMPPALLLATAAVMAAR